MKELTLMIRGLFGGMPTLFWAFIVLFIVVYALGICMTTMLGNRETRKQHSEEFEDEMEMMFSSLDLSMLTIFRCFIGDCSTSQGKPLISMLTEAYGGWFYIFYVAVMLFVIFGLFNLIMAVYLEKTLAFSRSAEMSGKAQKRESVRIARVTYKLLMKFSAAQHAAHEQNLVTPESIEAVLKTHTAAQLVDSDIAISRTTFGLVLQDPAVQVLLDDLDVQSERAGLFDVIDANCNGEIDLFELVRGLLRVRGDAPQRSDVLAAALGVRAVLDILKQQSGVIAEIRKLLAPLNDGGATVLTPPADAVSDACSAGSLDHSATLAAGSGEDTVELPRVSPPAISPSPWLARA